jgi:hypothetical protein
MSPARRITGGVSRAAVLGTPLRAPKTMRGGGGGSVTGTPQRGGGAAAKAVSRGTPLRCTFGTR